MKQKDMVARRLIVAFVVFAVLAMLCTVCVFALDTDTNAAGVLGKAPTNSQIEGVASDSYDYLTSILNFLRTFMVIVAAICLAASFIRFAMMSNAQKREAAKDKILVILVAVAIGAAAVSITSMAIKAGRNAASGIVASTPSRAVETSAASE